MSPFYLKCLSKYITILAKHSKSPCELFLQSHCIVSVQVFMFLADLYFHPIMSSSRMKVFGGSSFLLLTCYSRVKVSPQSNSITHALNLIVGDISNLSLFEADTSLSPRFCSQINESKEGYHSLPYVRGVGLNLVGILFFLRLFHTYIHVWMNSRKLQKCNAPL